MSLTFSTAIQSFHKALQLIMVYHQAKFGCKRISHSVNNYGSSNSYILVIIENLTVTLTLNTAHQAFAGHSGSWWGIAILSSVTKSSTIISGGKINILKLCCKLDLVIHSFHKTLHSWLWLKYIMMYHQTTFGCKRISSSEHINGSNSHVLLIWALIVTLNFLLVYQSVCMTFQLMVMHNRATLDYERFSGLTDIVGRNFFLFFKLNLFP